MTTELLRAGNSSISCTEDQCAFSSALMSTELEVLIEKKDKVFLKRLQLFFLTFLREWEKLYLNTKEAFHTFQQLLVKEILVNNGHRDLTLWSHSACYY